MKFNQTKRFVLLLLIYLGSITVQAQTVTIKGTVTSVEDGQPLPGVTIFVKGTTKGTISDTNGNYSIDAEMGDVLSFSFLGMTSKEVSVTGSEINVELKSEAVLLDEIVAIGYGGVKKKELTGAVAQLNADDISNTVTSDLASALQGQVAGVNVTASSGAPGAQAGVLIRGLSSIGGSNQPLYVVDGVPFDGDPGIDPNQIETVDILKDAASAAIYGTRGAAGVILITTKQGKAGTMKVDLNARYGIQNVTSATPLMNAAEQTYFNMVRIRNVSGTPDDEIILNLAQSPRGFLNDTDLRELVFIENAATQDYNVNISGGTDNLTYNVMASIYSNDGVIINSAFDRINTRANTTYYKGKWRINASIGMTNESIDRSPGSIITQTITYYPTQPTLDLDDDGPIYSQIGDETNRLNWVIESFKNTDETVANRSFANLSANYELAKGLEVNARLGLNVNNSYQHRFSPYQEIYNQFGKLTSDPSSSSVQMRAIRGRNLLFENGLRYRKDIDDHHFTIQAIYTIEDQMSDQFFARQEGVIDNSIRVLQGTSINPQVGSGFNFNNKQIGTLGRILYNYKGRYLLNVSARYDGSSKFAEKYRWGMFPSISGAWNVSDEKFWQPIKNTANLFKIRLGRGTVGNNRFPSYSYTAGINFGNDYAFGPDASDVLSLGAIQEEFANSEVKWETSVQWNGGIDLAMFNNKLTFTAEIYNTQKNDMLFPVTIPASASGSASGTPETVTLNVGDMTNKGIELSLGYRTITNNVKWGVNAVFSKNQNRITRMVTDARFILTNDFGLIGGARSSSQVTALAEGYEAGAFFLYTTSGVADTPEKLEAFKEVFPTARMGDLIYDDNNNDGKISEADRVYCGSGLPEYEAGVTLNAEYRGLDLSMHWYAAIGHEIMNGAKAMAYGYGRHKDLLYAWSEANPDSPIPSYRADIKSHDNFKGYTDLWLEDGTYLRLKNVTLGYSFPKSILQSVGIQRTRVFVTAQNPITFTKYEGYDPEVGGGIENRGLDKGNYPVTSLYTIGLNLNF